jgi:Ni,Fe-hydrogenase III small subunit
MRTFLLKAVFSKPATMAGPKPSAAALEEVGRALEERARRLYGRALSIRHVDAGSCNACELELHALNNAIHDLERFGIKFVASPRHADGLIVTGPVAKNMKVALERTYAATPDPKWVIACGDCAANCGVFAGSAAIAGPVSSVVPVDLTVGGCPPRPIALLEGLIALLDRAAARR